MDTSINSSFLRVFVYCYSAKQTSIKSHNDNKEHPNRSVIVKSALFDSLSFIQKKKKKSRYKFEIICDSESDKKNCKIILTRYSTDKNNLSLPEILMEFIL